MGLGDPDHQDSLDLLSKNTNVDCFRCEIPIKAYDDCYGCNRCNHFVHKSCFRLPQNMTHPLHSQHSLTLLPSSISSSSSQLISENCNLCHQPFFGGYAYHCETCLKFNLHIKCFSTLNLETKHHHPLSLRDNSFDVDCEICGLLIDRSDSYMFICVDCNFVIHFECAFLPPKVKHRHIHELTFEYNYPERSKVVDCDVCLNEDDGEELDRSLSYYYCESCDYIAHVRCATTRPAKVTTQFDHFIHEHPMIFVRNPSPLTFDCAACTNRDYIGSFYFCSLCNYALHKSCAQFPRFIKHPLHKENHILALQSCASQSKNSELGCCKFCTEELKGKGWIFQCSDCEFVVHLECGRTFLHPLHENEVFSFSCYDETKFRCNACGELGDGFRMSNRDDDPVIDFHVECFGLPGQIEHGRHSHPLYLVTSPTEIESDLSALFQCDICHTDADPDLWVYCCEICRYFAHLNCVVSDLLPISVSGRSCADFSNFCLYGMCEWDKFKVRKIKLDECSELIWSSDYRPLFLPGIFFLSPIQLIGDNNGQSVTWDVTDLDKPFADIICCPTCEKPISAQAYSSASNWVLRNLKGSIYDNQIETPADHGSLVLLDEKVVDELYCPICNLLIFPPTYSCAYCQIFFHKSCAELPRKYTVDGGHTFVLQSMSMNSLSLSNCSQCKRPCKGYAYFCTICEIWFDVTCALGAPLLKLENQKHSFYAMTSTGSTSLPKCSACHQCHTEGNIYFQCGVHSCSFNLHIECAMLPRVVKHRIHQHPLVLERHLDLSVDDYICDVCEKELNPCIWVYRCSDSCGDRATSHVSCIVNSNKKSHFVYDEECSYPHLIGDEAFRKEYGLPSKKRTVPALVAAIENKKDWLLRENLLLFVDDLEHEYADIVTEELMEMDQDEVFRLMESPDVLREKVAEVMKELTHVLPNADKAENAEDAEVH